MNDCCASSSSRDKVTDFASLTLPNYEVRPGVTFPDWSVVTSPAVKRCPAAMVGSDHVLKRWSGYDAAADAVRVALLQLYAEHGRAPLPSALAERAGAERGGHPAAARRIPPPRPRRARRQQDRRRLSLHRSRNRPPGHSGRTHSHCDVRGRRARHRRYDWSRHCGRLALPRAVARQFGSPRRTGAGLWPTLRRRRQSYGSASVTKADALRTRCARQRHSSVPTITSPRGVGSVLQTSRDFGCRSRKLWRQVGRSSGRALPGPAQSLATAATRPRHEASLDRRAIRRRRIGP